MLAATREPQPEMNKLIAEETWRRTEERKILRDCLVVPFLAGAACATTIAGIVGMVFGLIAR